MELFIPGLCIFFLAIAISFFIVPRATPLLTAILSVVFLVYGVYDHYQMFATEYRFTTWQDGLKLYAPAIMIGSLLLFVIYMILSLFTSGRVPIPPLPEIPVPSPNSITESIGNSLSNMGESISNIAEDVTNRLNEVVNNESSSAYGTNKGNRPKNTDNKGNSNKGPTNGVRRSFLETI